MGVSQGERSIRYFPNHRSSPSDELLPTRKGRNLPATNSVLNGRLADMSGLQVEHTGWTKPSTITWEAFEGQRHPRVQASSHLATRRRRLAYAFRLSQTQPQLIPLRFHCCIPLRGFDKLKEDHDRMFLKLSMPIGICSYGLRFRPHKHLPVWMSSWGTFFPTLRNVTEDKPRQKVITCKGSTPGVTIGDYYCEKSSSPSATWFH
jgi:hypothetical protein